MGRCDVRHEKVHVEGVMQLLAQPEFREIEKARPVLEFLESDELVLRELSASARASRGTESP